MASLRKATALHQLPADFNPRHPNPEHLIWPADQIPPVMFDHESNMVKFKKKTIDIPVTVDSILKSTVKEKVWLQTGSTEQEKEEDFYFDHHVISYRSTIYSLGYVNQDKERCTDVRQVFRFLDASSYSYVFLILWIDMHDKGSYTYKYTYKTLEEASKTDKPVHIRGFPRIWKEMDKQSKKETLFKSINLQCAELVNAGGKPISQEDVSIFPLFAKAILAKV